jgi:hypothetical protein
MLEPKLLTQEIDAALQANLTALREAFCDLLAALIMIIISLLSFLHAVLRVVFATLVVNKVTGEQVSARSMSNRHEA